APTSSTARGTWWSSWSTERCSSRHTSCTTRSHIRSRAIHRSPSPGRRARSTASASRRTSRSASSIACGPAARTSPFSFRRNELRAPSFVALSVSVAAALFGCGRMAFAQKAGPTRCELVQQPSTRLSSDSIPGVGQVLYVGGGPLSVLIKCPARGITLRGDSAQQYADHDQMIGHATYDEPRFHVAADYLNYFHTDDRVTAAGNVHARLASGSTL